jgi:hypothetical protein
VTKPLFIDEEVYPLLETAGEKWGFRTQSLANAALLAGLALLSCSYASDPRFGRTIPDHLKRDLETDCAAQPAPRRGGRSAHGR